MKDLFHVYLLNSYNAGAQSSKKNGFAATPYKSCSCSNFVATWFFINSLLKNTSKFYIYLLQTNFFSFFTYNMIYNKFQQYAAKLQQVCCIVHPVV